MNADFYHEFAVLAETRNFWEASERLFMNQSTLSKHIQSLEKELGVPLFTRNTRNVTLTEYGEAFLPYACSISRTIYDYSAEIKKISDAKKGTITIGSIPDMDSYGILSILQDFSDFCPGATLKMVEDDPNALRELLYSRKCELIFTRETRLSFENNFLDDNEVERIPYLQDHLVAVLPPDHTFADRDTITLKDLKEEKFCLLKENTLMYDLCISACQAAGFIPNIVFTSHKTGNIYDMVRQYRCVALLMDKHAFVPFERFPGDIPYGFKAVKISPEITSQISLCYLKKTKLSATAESFADFVRRIVS